MRLAKQLKEASLSGEKKGDSRDTRGKGGCCRVHGHHEKDGRI